MTIFLFDDERIQNPAGVGAPFGRIASALNNVPI
jgi:hypothetical protein